MLLEQWRGGRAEALDELLPLVYDELRKLAASRMRGERQAHTLQTTALVHETYLRMVGKSRVQIRDRAHFFAVAAQAMRRVLIDHARSHRAKKRDPAQALPIEIGQVSIESEELLLLDLALERLQALDPRQGRVVELRYFGGLTAPEVAEVLGVSEATVNREWRSAKLWLRREMKSGGSRDAAPETGGPRTDLDER